MNPVHPGPAAVLAFAGEDGTAYAVITGTGTATVSGVRTVAHLIDHSPERPARRARTRGRRSVAPNSSTPTAKSTAMITASPVWPRVTEIASATPSTASTSASRQRPRTEFFTPTVYPLRRL
jgi:hypothetical protein